MVKKAGCTFHNDAIDALLQETVLIHLVWTWLNYVVLEQKVFWILTSLYYLKDDEKTKLLWKQLAQIGKWLKFVLNDTRAFDWIWSLVSICRYLKNVNPCNYG